MNPYDGRALDEQLELEEEEEAIEARLAPVTIGKDERIAWGPAAVARELGMIRQALAYGLLEDYPELAFIQRNPTEAMVSSLQNVRGVIVETIATRVRQEQQDRGRARGEANKKSQIWHGLPCKPPGGPRCDDD